MEVDEGEAIPFIEIEENVEDKKTNFTIHPDAITALQGMREKKVKFNLLKTINDQI